MKKKKCQSNRVIEGYLEDLRRTLQQHHKGERLSITSKELGIQFDEDRRVIRQWVKALRERGIPICSGQQGYWYAASISDVRETARRLEDMITRISRTRAAVLAAAIRTFAPFTSRDDLLDQ